VALWRRRPLVVGNRFAAAIVGGYIFAYGFVGLATIIGFGLGLRFFDAADLARMLGFLLYLVVLLWGFVPRSGLTVWAVLGGGGGVMAALAWGLSRTLLS